MTAWRKAGQVFPEWSKMEILLGYVEDESEFGALSNGSITNDLG